MIYKAQETFFYYIQKILILTPLGIVSYFAPMGEVAGAVAFFVIADTITGIWAAKKQGIRIESKKSRQIVVKLIAYLTALILAFVFDNHIIQSEPLYTTRAAAFILASIEIQSNFENLYKISGILLWDKLRHLFQKPDNK